MERNHSVAGAELQEHDGWRIASYAADGGAAWMADVSHQGKLDVRGPSDQINRLTANLDLGGASNVDGVWTLRLSPTHAVVLCPFPRAVQLRERIASESPAICAIDMTCGWAAVVIGGDHVRDVFMRSSSLDVRPHRFPPGACMAGSVMRCGSIILHDPGDGAGQFWVLCPWEFGEFMWESLLDAGEAFGITPVSASVALRSEVAA
jgi:heterotetrameric sarcosine oxidase gamma subunit